MPAPTAHSDSITSRLGSSETAFPAAQGLGGFGSEAPSIDKPVGSSNRTGSFDSEGLAVSQAPPCVSQVAQVSFSDREHDEHPLTPSAGTDSSLAACTLQSLPPRAQQQPTTVLENLHLAQRSITEAIQAIQEQGDGRNQDVVGNQIESQAVKKDLSRKGSTFAAQKGEMKSTTSIWGMTPSISENGRNTVRTFGDSNCEGPLDEVANRGSDTGAALPANWPRVLRAREIIQSGCRSNQEDTMVNTTTTMNTQILRGKLKSRTSSILVRADSEAERRFCSRCIRGPDTVMYQVCNLCGLLLLLYDLIVMPVILAWSLPFNRTLVMMAWVSFFFWLSDMILNFSTGYFDIEGGVLHMDLRAAAKRYFRTWFLPDLAVVLTDLFSLILLTWTDSVSKSGIGARISRFARVGRFIRAAGMLRSIRVVRVLRDALMRSFSERQRICLRILAIASCWLGMNHVLACIWYAIGSHAPSDTGARWLERGIWAESEDNFGLSFQYATAMHWSVAQTTLGAMEVNSVNTAERMFTVSCLFVGLLLGSSLISALSAGLVEFRMSLRKQSHTMTTLCRYLTENRVTGHVALLVKRQAKARLNDTAMLAANDVPALATLAMGLQQKLHGEICQPHLQTHQLFQLWQHMDSDWFLRFCFKAVGLRFLRKEDDLFLPGNESNTSYFLATGTMEYTQVPESSPVLKVTKRAVEHGAWVCESALWVHWIHVGKLEAATKCHLLTIDAEGFALAVREHFTVGLVAVDYGRIFVERVLCAQPPRLPWPDDLSVPFTMYSDVVVAVPEDIQVLIGTVAIESCKRNFSNLLWSNTKARDKLRQEVEDGRSSVILDLTGAIERVVSVVVIHLTREDGRVFVRVAKWEDSHAVPDFQLPGAKCRRNETSDEAIERLLTSELTPMAAGVEVQTVDRGTAHGYSNRLGVRTKYIRTIFSSRFSGVLHAPMCAGDFSSSRPLRGSDRIFANATRLSWRNKSASRLSTRGDLDILEDRPVYFIPYGEGGAFYAWLRDCDLPRLEMLKNNGAIRKWLSTLNPAEDPHIVHQSSQSSQSSVAPHSFLANGEESTAICSV